MRGEVQIKVGDNVVYKNSNMLVDGASKLLADVMTVPKAYETMPEVSAVLDASNYTIQAISFGKGGPGYLENGHANSFTKTQYFLNKQTPTIITNKSESDVNDPNASSIIWGKDAFPPAPNPEHEELNLDCSVPIEYPGEIFGISTEVFSGFNFSAIRDFGQNLNYLPASIHTVDGVVSQFATNTNSIFSGIINVFDNVAAAIGSTLGCWPAGVSEGGTPYFVFSSLDEHVFTSIVDSNVDFSAGVYNADGTNYAQSGTLNGYFNEADSMDVSGFCTAVTGTDSTQGLTTSSAANFSSTGQIQYEVTMSSGDAVAAQLYGGIFNIGLWTIDVGASIEAGFLPPLDFNVIGNERRYRLFARKDLTKSFTAYQDTQGLAGAFTGNYYPATQPAAEEVEIKWIIHLL